MRGLGGTRSAIGDIRRGGVRARGSERSFSGGSGWFARVGCVGIAGRPAARDRDVAGSRQPGGHRVSPDGANVYVTTSGNGPWCSAQRQAQLSAVCSASRGGRGAAARWPAPAGLSGPGAIAISPDGGSVYVANSAGNRVLAFDRVGGGALALKPGRLLRPPAGGLPCTDARAMLGPQDLAIAGGTLYVASSAASSVTALKIGPAGDRRGHDIRRVGRVHESHRTPRVRAGRRPVRSQLARRLGGAVYVGGRAGS